MTAQLREAIARLRETRFHPIRSDIHLVCDALEAHLKPTPAFDKVAYQREYMRKVRKAEKKLREAEERWADGKEYDTLV